MTPINGIPRLVPTPELPDAEFHARILTVGEMRRIEGLRTDESIGDVDKMVAFFMAGACFESGDRQYADGEEEKVLALPWTAVQRVAAVVIEINGLAPDDDEEPEGN